MKHQIDAATLVRLRAPLRGRALIYAQPDGGVFGGFIIPGIDAPSLDRGVYEVEITLRRRLHVEVPEGVPLIQGLKALHSMEERENGEARG